MLIQRQQFIFFPRYLLSTLARTALALMLYVHGARKKPIENWKIEKKHKKPFGAKLKLNAIYHESVGFLNWTRVVLQRGVGIEKAWRKGHTWREITDVFRG